MLDWLKSDYKAEDLKEEDSFIEMQDFTNALTRIMPTAKREGFATVPDVNWDNIGALKSIRSELEWSILVRFLFFQKKILILFRILFNDPKFLKFLLQILVHKAFCYVDPRVVGKHY